MEQARARCRPSEPSPWRRPAGREDRVDYYAVFVIDAGEVVRVGIRRMHAIRLAVDEQSEMETRQDRRGGAAFRQGRGIGRGSVAVVDGDAIEEMTFGVFAEVTTTTLLTPAGRPPGPNRSA